MDHFLLSTATTRPEWLDALGMTALGELDGMCEARDPDPRFARLERCVVHEAPHLDEYLAELLFRLALPAEQRGLPLVEGALHAPGAAEDVRALWPTAAVFGLGRGEAESAEALFLYDEHRLPDGPRQAASCATLVARDRCRHLAPPLQRILDETAYIDAHGSAGDWHLNNLIKMVHESLYANPGYRAEAAVRAAVNLAKRDLFTVMLAAVARALTDGVPLDDPEALKRSMKVLLASFKRERQDDSPHATRVLELMATRYLNTAVMLRDIAWASAFEQAGVPPNERLRRERRKLLCLHAIVHACRHIHGEETTLSVCGSLLDADYRFRATGMTISAALPTTLREPAVAVETPLGLLRLQVLPDVDFAVALRAPQATHALTTRYPLALAAMTAAPAAIQPHRSLTQFLGRQHLGVGLVFIEDGETGSKYLGKGRGVSDAFWARLTAHIDAQDPGAWTIITDNGRQAPFILNGNRAHRAVAPAHLTLDSLAQSCREVARRHPDTLRVEIRTDNFAGARLWPA
jgi:hypothetical protein